MSRQASSPLALDTSERQLSRLSMSVLRLHLDHWMMCVVSTTTSRAYSPSVLTIVMITGTTTITMSHPVMRTHQIAMRMATMLLNSNLSPPLSTPDDSGSDPTPDDERHHLSAALTSKLKKHKSSRTRPWSASTPTRITRNPNVAITTRIPLQTPPHIPTQTVCPRTPRPRTATVTANPTNGPPHFKINSLNSSHLPFAGQKDRTRWVPWFL